MFFFADLETCGTYDSNIAGWKMDHLKMYFLLKMGIFHCHVSCWYQRVTLIFSWPFKHLDRKNSTRVAALGGELYIFGWIV